MPAPSDYAGVVKKQTRDGARLTVGSIYCAGCRKETPTNLSTEYADGALYCRRCTAEDAK